MTQSLWDVCHVQWNQRAGSQERLELQSWSAPQGQPLCLRISAERYSCLSFPRRTDRASRREANAACAVINWMTSLGIPTSRKAA